MEDKRINFTVIKEEFDNTYGNKNDYESPIPIHLTCNKKVKIKNNKGEKNEKFSFQKEIKILHL